jgi:hypothetical protein
MMRPTVPDPNFSVPARALWSHLSKLLGDGPTGQEREPLAILLVKGDQRPR